MDNTKYQELMKNHHHNGKNLQEYYPLNSTCKEFSDNYRSSNDRKSFYINSPCIVADKRTINKNKSYLLFDLESHKDQIKESNVILFDAYYHNQSAYLYIMDDKTGEKRVISLFLEHPMDKCPWFLFDLDYLHRTFKSTNNHGDMLIGDNELLEF